MQDEVIISMLFRRDENAIAELQNAYGARCFHTANGILSSEEDSTECVNDALLRVWNSVPPERPRDLAAYFAKITRNLAINRYKAQHAKRRGGGELTLALDELSECIPSSGNAENGEITAVLNTFLASLSERERGMFMRRYWFSETLSEIAAHYGTTEKTVKTALSRTRKKLRKTLEREEIYL